MSTAAIVISVIVLVFLLIVLASCIKIVPQASIYVIEKFGSFHCEWETGLHFLVPIAMRIAGKVSLK